MNGSPVERPWGEYGAMAVASVLALILLMLRAASEGLLELGDGVNHYLIARYAWVHPERFLDLWGKPLFTLLSSPFAQAGHAGIAAFNALVAAVSAWVAILGLRRAGVVAQFAFPVLAMLSPQYVLTIVGGMTEPLFGLVTILTLVLLLFDRPIWAALVASLSPLARPEYVAFLPLVVGYLVWRKQWRALPWVLFGLVLYALLALEFYQDPTHFWTADPYSWSANVYGSGPWDFFLVEAERIYGLPLMVLGIMALLAWPFVQHFDEDHRSLHRTVFVVAALSALGILAVHSILWWQGWRGSAGLIRVLATSVPMAGFFVVLTISRGVRLILPKGRVEAAVGSLALVGLVIWTADDLRAKVELPAPMGPDQLVLEEAAARVVSHREEGERVFSTHPYMAFGAGLDPFDAQTYNPLWGLTSEDVDVRLKTGDLILWDSQLGSNESGIPLQHLIDDERLGFLDLLEPSVGSRRLGGHLYEFFLFERRDVRRWFEVDTFLLDGRWTMPLSSRVDTLPLNGPPDGKWTLMQGQFPLEMTKLPTPTPDRIFDEWSFRGTLEMEADQDLRLVLKVMDGDVTIRYDEERLSAGPLLFERRVPRSSSNLDLSIYFWSVDGRPFTLDRPTLIRRRWMQAPR